MKRLESLLCDYSGPMKGRNRNRVLHHVGAVAERLELVKRVRADAGCLDILRRHFREEIPPEKASRWILERLSTKPAPGPDGLASFMHRQHVEFHPCDACNLACSGCTYFHDSALRPAPLSFPFDCVARICAVIQPKAVTIVGGGEPALYRSGGRRLGDLVCALGNGDLGCSPAIGLITNGTLWPPGNPQWHQHVQWIRFSLDASTPESYAAGKGKDYFDRVVHNVFRTLTATDIPQVGVGFLYHPGNALEAGPVISLFAHRVRELCPDEVHRLNIQFRPWRVPTGHPSIRERILSTSDVEKAAAVLFGCIERDSFLQQFMQQHTNIAVNLLCGGARETASPFSECYFGLAKTVVRADGSLYPCFRVAAQEEAEFYCGNILTDPPLKIALRELYGAACSVQEICVPDYESCLFCIFNNMLEAGVMGRLEPPPELPMDFFF